MSNSAKQTFTILLIILKSFFLMAFAGVFFIEGPFPWILVIIVLAVDISFSVDYFRKLTALLEIEKEETEKLMNMPENQRDVYDYEAIRMINDIRTGTDTGELLQDHHTEERQTKNH